MLIIVYRLNGWLMMIVVVYYYIHTLVNSTPRPCSSCGPKPPPFRGLWCNSMVWLANLPRAYAIQITSFGYVFSHACGCTLRSCTTWLWFKLGVCSAVSHILGNRFSSRMGDCKRGRRKPLGVESTSVCM